MSANGKGGANRGAEDRAGSGTVRPFSLDCSGFVDWVFYNQSGGQYIIGHGGGASAQHSYCTPISWNNAKPGDLVFYPGDSHVGIVCGIDSSGNILIIHCASSSDNVVETGKIGFTMIGRPKYFTE
ncbi:CHAP domain-containing protein [Butyricicoccus sp. AM28-25]|nr:CHAP domain-containing protein [Butyricicoccus sp. AM28-25]